MGFSISIHHLVVSAGFSEFFRAYAFQKVYPIRSFCVR
jgi:hypothetical protein